MSPEPSTLYVGPELAEAGDVAAAPAAAAVPVRSLEEARIQLETLRSINAHLVRQVNLLRQREAQAQRLADRDGLTGLFNRRKMLESLDGALADAEREGHRVGLLFVDLDGFKHVNDTHGHVAGDKLLMTVAGRIAGRARTGDLVCRYGGDEFVVILPRVDDVDSVRQVADSIRQRVALPYRVEGTELHVTAAIGAAVYPDLARTASDLLERADAAMYRVKAQDSDAAATPVPAPARRREDQPHRRHTG